MAYASVQDIASRWRPLEEEESAVAPTLLEDASDILDTEMPLLAGAYGQGGRLDRMTIATVVAMVVRVLRNPDAMRQQSVGDVQQTFGGPEYDGRLFLAEDELAALAAVLADVLNPGAGTTSGAFVIDPVSAKLARRAPCTASFPSPR